MIRKGTATSEEIMIRKGVKQGCPLSPLLFDLCLEPLLRVIETHYSDLGYHLGDTNATKTIQAYADDLILFSDNERNMNDLLKVVENFLSYSKLRINHNKCRITSIGNRDNKRVTLDSQFQIGGTPLPSTNLDDGIEYLGTCISNNRSKRLKSAEESVVAAIRNIERLDNVPLRFNQKVDAIKRFIIPSLDHMMTNGEVPLKAIDKLEAAIRRMINKYIGNTGVLKEFGNTHWKDGGIGFQPIKEREHALRIKLMAALFNSASKDTMKIMRLLAEEERVYRNIAKVDPGNSGFLDWETNENGEIMQNSTHGCDSIVIRAMNSAKKLNVKIAFNDNNDVVIYDSLANGSQPVMLPKDIVRMLIERTRENKWKELKSHPFHGHTFTLTRNSVDSNYFIGNPTCRMSDKMVKFVLKGRLNQLPTGELLDKQTPNGPRHRCPTCNDNDQVDSLRHRLNSCLARRNEMTLRHNAVQNVIKKAIETKLGIPVKNNSTVKIGNVTLPPRSAQLKPDLWFIKDNTVQLVEFTIPYGDTSQTEQGNTISSLTKKHDEKVRKYSNLLQDIKDTYNKEAHLTVIVVSSLGVIPSRTIRAIQNLLHLSNRNLQKIVRRIVFEAIRGSYLLFYNIKQNSREAVATAADDRTLGDLDREEPPN